MSGWWMLLALLIAALVGALVIAPLMVRSADWLVDHEPRWYRWWMNWIGGKRS